MQLIASRSTKISNVTSRRKRQELQEDFEENLVAELCVRFEFPSVLWLKATCLPTILHRITYLLLSEELRQNIARDTGVGCVELPPGEVKKLVGGCELDSWLAVAVIDVFVLSLIHYVLGL